MAYRVQRGIKVQYRAPLRARQAAGSISGLWVVECERVLLSCNPVHIAHGDYVQGLVGCLGGRGLGCHCSHQGKGEGGERG